MRGLSLNGTMAADSSLLLSLVEEYVSGLQDSKAGDTAAGKDDFITFLLDLVLIRSVWLNKAPVTLLSCRLRMRNTA